MSQDTSKALRGKLLSSLRSSSPRDHTGVNHNIFHNKDGRYAWRPFELIHPALYVSLVNTITAKNNWKLIHRRFRDFRNNSQIQCLSIPVESKSEKSDRAALVTQWWEQVEQRSVELALDFDLLFQTDIVDCYGAIYTHSIAWALHSKKQLRRTATTRT